jgi:hypothetical protein
MSLDINLTGVEKTSNKKTTLTDNSDTFYPTQKAVKTAVDLKVDAVAGKGLSANDFTNTLKTKLDGIQDGAEVNVNADWNATSGDAQILNKPTIPDSADFVEKSDFTSHSILAKQSGASDPVAVSIGNNEILGRKSGGGSDIEGLSVSEVKSLLNYTASDVGAVATTRNITINGTTQDLSADRTFSAVMLTGMPNIANVGISGSLRYFGFSGLPIATSEVTRRIIICNNVTLKNFYVYTSTTQPATGSHVLTIFKNGVATAITITIPSGSGAGLFSDTTNSESFVQGDAISIQAVNNALVNSGVIVSFQIGTL